VTSYSIAYTYYPNSPRSWALEGSDDGETWVTLDETSAAEAVELKPAESEAWINGGKALQVYDTCAFGELELYDIWGNRLNVGLTDLGNDYGGALPENSATYSCGAGFAGLSDGADKLYDDNAATAFALVGTPVADPKTESTWTRFVMHLSDGCSPVASYNFLPLVSGDTNRRPVSWQVEVSADGGATWTAVDEREGDEATALMAEGDDYCNDGYPIGFTSGLDHSLSPASLTSVEVASDAQLELPPTCSVNSLVIDLSQSGQPAKIVNFRPAADGMLVLTGSETTKPAFEDEVLNVEFVDPVGLTAITNWQVSVNGVVQRPGRYSLRVDSDGKVRISKVVFGLTILVR